MGADGCRRVSEYVGTESKRNYTHNNPQTAHSTTCQNTETNNNKIWLTNFVENINNIEKNVGGGETQAPNTNLITYHQPHRREGTNAATTTEQTRQQKTCKNKQENASSNIFDIVIAKTHKT